MKEFNEFKVKAEQDKTTTKEKLEIQQSIIRAFDLIRMYRYYVVESIVGGDWGRFCEVYYRYEDNV